MKNISRRDFVKESILFYSFLFNPNYLVGEDIPKQGIFVNLPSYSLSLINLLDNNFSDIYNFEVGIGKGERGRRQTPIGEGFVYEKREKVVFRYGEDYPLLNLKKGDIIKWTNTFDKTGKPIGYNMPYSNMRGLGMKIKNKIFKILPAILFSVPPRVLIKVSVSSNNRIPNPFREGEIFSKY